MPDPAVKVFLAANVALVLVFSPVEGQQYDGVQSDLALLSVNVVVGGASAAVVAFVRGGDISDAFTAGALGGGLSFAGKHVAARSFTGSALLGRQVAAIGHGIVVDAGRGAPLLSEVWLPVGPLQVRVPSRRGDGQSGWDARLDMTATAGIVYAATRSDLDVDWGLTAELGTPVFRGAHDEVDIAGDSVEGAAPLRTIVLSGDASRSVVAHEVVHVIQQDFVAMAWSYPAEESLRALLGADQRWLERVPLGAAAPLLAQLVSAVTGENTFVLDLMEEEAYSLVRRERPVFTRW